MPELRHARRRPDAARGHARRRARQRPPEEGPLIPRKTKLRTTLVIGIGNPGRRDDGLGAAAVERLKRRRLRGVACDANYQLNVEDALACAGYDTVIFVDAARGVDEDGAAGSVDGDAGAVRRLRKPFTFTRVRAAGSMPAMSHALRPEAVLAIAAELYGKTPDARLLAIRGKCWEVGEGLSAEAEADLALALEFLEGFLKEVRP
ncbi:MAG: hydrogenase maturation protease [Acidobacteria bacterium]|nr:hydrogenase maturation protease [Acidobacteriota bacterium]MBE3124624.1 hydrogenase maturation protease [Acidobacteriota bacterium]